MADRYGLLLTGAVLAAVGAVLAAKGVHQVLVEIPQTAAYLETYGRPAGLAGAGAERAFAARVRATTPTGFWGLSNPLASLLVLCLLAAAGLAADKCRRAIRDRRVVAAAPGQGRSPCPDARGGRDGPAGCGRRGGAGADAQPRGNPGGRGGPGRLGGGDAMASRHWRAAGAGRSRSCVVLFLIGCACVIGYGLAKDRLPSKTMTFRWYYWTAAAAMVADHPLLGVGPGNFPSAYLRYRRLGAEEAVKLPHNVVAEAVSQYGIPGGAVYLAVVLVVLVGMCRPALARRRRACPLAGAGAGQDVAAGCGWSLAVAAGGGGLPMAVLPESGRIRRCCCWTGSSRPCCWRRRCCGSGVVGGAAAAR